jgi:hypothetical protein
MEVNRFFQELLIYEYERLSYQNKGHGKEFLGPFASAIEAGNIMHSLVSTNGVTITC